MGCGAPSGRVERSGWWRGDYGMSKRVISQPSRAAHRANPAGSLPGGRGNNDVVGWHQRVNGDMRPSEALKVQVDGLRVLNLREMNRELTRHVGIKRRGDGECWHALAG